MDNGTEESCVQHKYIQVHTYKHRPVHKNTNCPKKEPKDQVQLDWSQGEMLIYVIKVTYLFYRYSTTRRVRNVING